MYLTAFAPFNLYAENHVIASNANSKVGLRIATLMAEEGSNYTDVFGDN